MGLKAAVQIMGHYKIEGIEPKIKDNENHVRNSYRHGNGEHCIDLWVGQNKMVEVMVSNVKNTYFYKCSIAQYMLPSSTPGDNSFDNNGH